MRRKNISLWLLSCLVAVQSVFLALVTIQPAVALTNDDMVSNVKTFSYYASLHSCLLAGKSKANYNNNDSLGLLMEGDYWVSIGYVVESDGDNNDGGVTCQNSIKFAVDKLGFSKEDLLRGLGYTFNAANSVWSSTANASSRANNFETLAKSKGIPTSEAGYYWYQFALAAFTNSRACNAKEIGPLSSVDSAVKSQAEAKTAGYYVVQKFDDTSGAMSAYVFRITDSLNNHSRDTRFYTYARPGDTNADQGISSCYTMGSDLGGPAATKAGLALGAATGAEAKEKMETTFTSALGESFCKNAPAIDQAACYSSVRAAVTSCSTSYFAGSLGGASRAITVENVNNIDVTVLAKCIATKISQPLPEVLAVLKAAQETAKTPIDKIDPDVPVSEAAVCQGGALGFILCPLTNMFSSMIGSLAGFIEHFLVYDPLMGSDQGAAIQTIWRYVVNIANILLVIAFLIVIFSQATSIGLSAYGIKKMLPRIIAAAILINLSFFICALAVDVSNVLGAAVQGIIETATATVTGPRLSDSQGSLWLDSVVYLLGIIGTSFGAVALVSGSIFYIVPILLSAALTFLMAFILLAVRQVLITLLIIISPLAFAAFVLPNTESLFKKWQKTLITLLLLYPMIMIVFYGSNFMSRLIIATSKGATDEVTTINNIIAFLIIFVPLFILPTLIKSAGGFLEKIGALVNDRGKGLLDRNKKWAGDRSDTRHQYRKDVKMSKLSETPGRWQRKLPAYQRLKRQELYRNASEESKLNQAKVTARQVGSDPRATAQAKARAEAIIDEIETKEAKIKLDFTFKGDAQAALDHAMKTRDQTLMNLSAGKMVDTAHLKEVQDAMGSSDVDSEQAASMARYIQNNHFPKMKEQDLGMMYAVNDMADETKDAKTVLRDLQAGAYDTKAASGSNVAVSIQETYALQRQVDSGKLTADKAAAVLKDPNAASGIKEGQRKILEDLVKSATPPPPSP